MWRHGCELCKDTSGTCVQCYFLAMCRGQDIAIQLHPSRKKAQFEVSLDRISLDVTSAKSASCQLVNLSHSRSMQTGGFDLQRAISGMRRDP